VNQARQWIFSLAPWKSVGVSGNKPSARRARRLGNPQHKKAGRVTPCASLSWFWCVWLLWLAALSSTFGFTITRTSSPVFYLDTSITPTLQGMYVSYQINNNSGITYPDIWVRIDNFSGGVISLAPSEDGLVHLGPLGPGETKAAFFYLRAGSETAVPQAHTVSVYPSRVSAASLASASFSMTTQQTIEASANKVVTVVTGPLPPQLGGILTMTVTGDAGTIGATRVMSFSPAAYLDWRPDAYELLSSSITLSGGNNGTYNDQLLIIAGSATATTYSAVYRFRAVTTTTTPTTISPIGFISSGTPIKHTTTGNYGSLPPVQPAENHLTVGKRVGVSELFGADTVNFSLFATNSGTVEAILEDFVDTLPSSPAVPSYVAGSSAFNGTPIGDPIITGGTLTWIGTFTLTPGTIRALTYRLSFADVKGSYTNRAVAHVGTTQIDTTLNTSDNAPAFASFVIRGLSISGFVYLDANRNSQKDAGENGTSLNLFAKLIRGSGPALQAVTVTNSSGAYSFPNITPGTYVVVIDDNNNLPDIAPAVVPGWIGTEQPTLARNNVLVISADVLTQNFGLFSGLTLTGRTFNDSGSGGGIANDGLMNGAEAGLAGHQIRLTDASGTVTFDTAVSAASGQFSLLIPVNVPPGTQLKVVEANPSGFLSTGGSAGSSGGTYDRAADTVTFAYASTNVQGLQFGNVAPNTFLNDSQQTGLPGSFVLHPHTFIAHSAGQLSFSLSTVAAPNISGWTPIIYLDGNCNGQLDNGEAPITAALAASFGQQVCILIKDTIPLFAPFNAQHQITVRASFAYSSANPSLLQTNTRLALTIVGNPTTAGLTLTKVVDKEMALPGENITYTLTYANQSSQALNNIIIFDSTPAYTRFLSAGAGPLPSNLSAVTIATPAIGGSGPIQWTFNGALGPGQTASVTFSVIVAQ
jgi:uncharacterized repeat protein (TIGR01451 family)